MADHLKLNAAGVIEFAGHHQAGWVSNLGLTTGADATQIRITGVTATLSATNPLHVSLPDESSAGRVSLFTATADVDIDLTGAHWGFDTLGDLTDIQLRVYAINDNGNLKWGIALKGGVRSLATAKADTTASNINLKDEFLVNSAIGTASQCREVGWFNANFTDSGDEWAIQTGNADLNVGIPVPDHTDWGDSSWTPTGSWVSGITYSGLWRRVGDNMEAQVEIDCSGGVTSTGLTINMPSGYSIDSSKLAHITSNEMKVGYGTAQDTGVMAYPLNVRYSDATTLIVHALIDDQGAGSAYVGRAQVNDTIPLSFASGDNISLFWSVPILGWSSNGAL